MRSQTGPTTGQIQRLRDLGWDPNDFQLTPSSQIFAIIEKGLRSAGHSVVREQQIEAERWRERRLKIIAEQGLRPGMVVLRKSHHKKEGARWIRDTITGITPDGHICFEGITKLVNPSQIKLLS